MVAAASLLFWCHPRKSGVLHVFGLFVCLFVCFYFFNYLFFYSMLWFNFGFVLKLLFSFYLFVGMVGTV